MKSKKLTALLAMVMISATAMTAFSGCGGTIVQNDDYDPTKANLSVATFDGGVGRAWLEEAIERFEAMYATATHFQEGKTGVKISLDGDKNKYTGSKLAESGNLNKDVYFTEAVEYYTFVNSDLVADISDVVTGSMEAYGESGTIEDKIDPNVKEFMTAKDGKYYMIPFYDGYYGFTYDIELFEEEGFYFDKAGDFIGLDENATEEERAEFEAAKSNGPDGKPNTYDDGLPATYQDMITLCDRIVAKGCVPFCYSGNYTGYVNRAFISYVADYEGYDAFSVNKTFSGKNVKLAKTITEIPGQIEASIEFETVDITPSNGYQVARQAGRYYALKMQEELFGSTKYIGGKHNGLDYTVAQSDFIKSKYTAAPYAILAEGVWWENEANATFVQLETQKGESKMDRRFGYMPIPKVNAAAAGDQTMFSVNSSFGFINKNATNMELAKEFMRFLHTDVEMSKFSAKTSIPRSLSYEVSEEDRATATNYGKSVIDMRSQSKVVYPFSSLDIVVNNASYFDNDNWFFLSTVNGKTLNNPFAAFMPDKNGKTSATALSYFNGALTRKTSVWSALVK